MTAHDLFSRLATLVGPETERKFRRRDLCILATRIAIDVAEHFGIEAYAVPVRAIVYNAAFASHVDQGDIDVKKWTLRDGSYSVGVGYADGPLLNGWAGHLIAAANGIFGDFSIRQAERTQYKIVTGKAIVGVLPARDRWTYENNTGTRIDYCRIADQTYEASPDWNDRARRKRMVKRLIREIQISDKIFKNPKADPALTMFREGGRMIALCGCGHLEDTHVGRRCTQPYCKCSEFKAAAESPDTATMRELVEFALKRAKRELSDKGRITAFFVWRGGEGDHSLHYFPLPAQYGDIMNSGAGKEALFGVIRQWCQVQKPAVFGICTDAWRGRTTAKTKGLTLDEATEGGFHKAVERGMLTKEECINVTVQTPRRAMVAWQSYQRIDTMKMILYGEFAIVENDIDFLGGRQKLFGDLSEENIR